MVRPTPPEGAFQSLQTRVAGGFKTAVLSLAWTCDGRTLLVAGDTSTVRRFDMERLAQRDQISTADSRPLPPPRPLPQPITHVASSPREAGVCATVSSDGTLCIFRGTAWKSVALDRRVRALAWSLDGDWLVVADVRNAVHLVSAAPCVKERSVDFEAAVNSMAFSSDGELLFVALGNGRVHVKTWPKLAHGMYLDGHRAEVLALAVEGRRMAVASADRLVSAWDLTCMRSEYVVDRLDSDCRCIDISARGAYIALASDKGGIEILVAETGRRVVALPTTGTVKCLEWHPTQLLLAYCVVFDAAAAGRERQPARLYSAAPPVVPPHAKAFVYGFPAAQAGLAQRKR